MSDKDRNIIVLGSEVDISMAGILYQQLSSALDTEQTPVLDGSETQRIDTAGIQILMAFRKQAEHQGRDWEWLNRPSCLERAESLLGAQCA